MSPGVTVEATTRPTVCVCRCGCDYRLQSEASVAAATCFSCRVDLHAGRAPGWRPTDRTPVEPDEGPRGG